MVWVYHKRQTLCWFFQKHRLNILFCSDTHWSDELWEMWKRICLNKIVLVAIHLQYDSSVAMITRNLQNPDFNCQVFKPTFHNWFLDAFLILDQFFNVRFRIISQTSKILNIQKCSVPWVKYLWFMIPIKL